MKRLKTESDSLVSKVLGFFSKFIPDLTKGSNTLKAETERLKDLNDKTEKVLQKMSAKIESNAETELRKRETFDEFVEKRREEGLRYYRSCDDFLGTCDICSKHIHHIESVPTYDPRWVGEGRSLKKNRKRTWNDHIVSKMHQKSMTLHRDRVKESAIFRSRLVCVS